MQFKLMPERRPQIMNMWWRRLQGCRASVEDWQDFLMVRSIVVESRDMCDTWLKFAALCRNQDKLQMAERILAMLEQAEVQHYNKKMVHKSPSEQRSVVPLRSDLIFAKCKLQWRQKKEAQALSVSKQIVKMKSHRLFIASRASHHSAAGARIARSTRGQRQRTE